MSRGYRGNTRPHWRQRFGFPLLRLAGLALHLTTVGFGVVVTQSSGNVSFQDSYNILIPRAAMIALAAAFAGYAIAHLALPALCGRSLPAWVGWLHFGATMAGTVMMTRPTLLVGLPRRYAEYEAAFAHWNRIATIGVALALTSALFFAVGVVTTVLSARR